MKDLSICDLNIGLYSKIEPCGQVRRARTPHSAQHMGNIVIDYCCVNWFINMAFVWSCADVQLTVESLMNEIINSLERGENVYFRGFGSFIVKKRAEKTARNIKKNTTIKIPAHNIPAFKPSKFFIDGVKTKLKIN